MSYLSNLHLFKILLTPRSPGKAKQRRTDADLFARRDSKAQKRSFHRSSLRIIAQLSCSVEADRNSATLVLCFDKVGFSFNARHRTDFAGSSRGQIVRCVMDGGSTTPDLAAMCAFPSLVTCACFGLVPRACTTSASRGVAALVSALGVAYLGNR